jgi:DNA-binding NarL/FixJ family response regulator
LLVIEPAPESPEFRSVDGLSPRESQVLHMVARGHTNGQIATDLGVTVHAVKFHLASVYRKLNVANRTEAAVTLLALERAAD